ncbi:MAG: hypothetical protein EOP50_22850 [Sphingobacteriales bacterium]|nr:MAG: hypothetical protein EOP50_22850 [Sphingobacteriales bacterium]
MRFLFFLLLPFSLMAQNKETPDHLYGTLFTDVQQSGIFPDSKTFVDAIPKGAPADIRRAYEAVRTSTVDRTALEHFIEENFFLPQKPISDYEAQDTDVVAHIERLWHVLHRKADAAAPGSSLLSLPHSYVVPGGRFREVYYWDSYFTMLGLKESGEDSTIEHMVQNFAWLIDTT